MLFPPQLELPTKKADAEPLDHSAAFPDEKSAVPADQKKKRAPLLSSILDFSGSKKGGQSYQMMDNTSGTAIVDPFNMPHEMVQNIGQVETGSRAVYGAVRFGRNYLLAVEEVPLDSTKYQRDSFQGWTLVRGSKEQLRKMEEAGKTIFKFGGNLKTLAELHRGLRQIKAFALPPINPTASSCLEITLDEDGERDISSYFQWEYSNKVFSFGDIRMWVELTSFSMGDNKKGDKKNSTPVPMIALAKRKTEKAIKMARRLNPQAKDFYLTHVPVSQLDQFIVAAEIHMVENGIKPLDLFPDVELILNDEPMGQELVPDDDEDKENEEPVVRKKSRKIPALSSDEEE